MITAALATSIALTIVNADELKGRGASFPDRFTKHGQQNILQPPEKK